MSRKESVLLSESTVLELIHRGRKKADFKICCGRGKTFLTQDELGFMLEDRAEASWSQHDIWTQNHIMVWVRRSSSCNALLTGRDAFHCWLLEATSNLALNTSRDGASMTVMFPKSQNWWKCTPGTWTKSWSIWQMDRNHKLHLNLCSSKKRKKGTSELGKKEKMKGWGWKEVGLSVLHGQALLNAPVPPYSHVIGPPSWSSSLCSTTGKCVSNSLVAVHTEHLTSISS